MNSKKTVLSLIAFIFLQSLIAQNFSGQWEGYITQDNLSDKFKYTINVQQRGNSIYGTSASLTMDGEHGARFELSGFWDGKILVLQELKQTMPSQPQWCIKYATLTLDEDGAVQKLSGRWKANGCTPGDMVLSRKLAMKTDTLVQEINPTLTGKWTGTLSQSDRDYGFYFEAEFTEGGEGQSYIVSEDNGGSATHLLNWSSLNKTRLTFEESGILKKSDGDWRWCIKSGDLKFRRDGSRLILEGTWSGYIEGYTKETGACAKGRLYLEKPVMTETIIRHQKAIQQPYESESQRTVKIERVLEVSRPNIKLKVWDNGTVDGDVVTLFLNGERILHNHRVSKRKIGIPVTLQQEANFLILHAEDLGDISPNTVAVAVDDGEKEQVIILSSNLEESGAVMIRQFKVN
ncbi:MAG: hypothetical protein MI974_21455 [Chitinophagales bacterium]|nr:hypothetical protein [Chitinophagales bacterium]